VFPSPPLYDLHSQSPCLHKVRDVCGHHSSYPHVVCSYFQSFDHDVNSCPDCDILMNHILDLMQ